MRENPVKRTIASGGVSLGTMAFEFNTPGLARLAAGAGAKFCIFDQEHTGWSIETIKLLVATSGTTDMVPMVRVPTTRYHLIARVLDVGARGIMVPMVESVEQAKAIAQAARYPATGRRGAAFGFAHDDYTSGDPRAKMETANARNFVIAQIETERGLAVVEDIAAVDGIDCLWLGHFDLSNFLGIPAQFDNPVFTDAVKRIVAAGRKHNKARGYMAADPAVAKEYHALGFNMIASGTDQGLLIAGVRNILQAVGGK